ncbi:uncharacterized protein [Aristolochia californica]|uniref:uncharacterized protein n=1 Tax=Aristolochia californica TaxID=171875 RepID=UPI0035DF85C4
MIEATGGGALVDKSPEAARNLIANMAANSQQFGTRLDLPSKNVNEVNISSIEQQIVSLTSLVRQMAVGNMQTEKACGICLVVGHPTDMCLTLQEEPTEQVNAAGGFPGQPQRKYDPYSNTYNMGWMDHPNLSYGNPQVNQLATQNHPSYQQYRQPYPPRQQPGQNSNSGMSSEDIAKYLATNNLKFQQKTWASIQSKDNQMVQMAITISRIEAQISGKLPSQTVVNPRENASAIFLRSGKEVEIPVKATPASLEQVKEKNIIADMNVPNDDDVPKRNIGFEKAMIDLGSSTNVMPYSIYASLKLGPLNKAGGLIQLHDKSNAYPKGVVEDVLVQASKTKKDVHSGTLTMKFDGEIVKFDIYDATKYPGDDNPIYSIDVIDSFAQEIFELDEKDELEVAISKHLEKENEELALSSDLQKTAPTLDLKHLHSHLRYVFLGDGGTLPVIIFSKLSAPQEEKHVQDELHLQEMFPDVKLLSASVTLPWYANIVGMRIL